MRFNKKEVLSVERILMIRDPKEYTEAVSGYEFRDLRLERVDRATKLTHLVASFFDLNVAFWYVSWAAATVAAALLVQ
jgi:hypothetical protein